MTGKAPDLLATTARLLRDIRTARSRPDALDELFDRMYPHLRRLAAHILSRRARGRPDVSATTLVHSACARLMKGDLLAEDRRHSFRLFCKAMDREWIDRIRHDVAKKRGGGLRRELLRDAIATDAPDYAAYIDLREALAELTLADSDAAEVVRLRYYCGATLEETAEIMGRTLAIVRRDWAYAKSWLRERLDSDAAARAPS